MLLATMSMLLLLDGAFSNCPIAPDVPCPPVPLPPHYYSCTANMTGGGPRLPYAFCNASLPLEVRLDDLLARATYDEKAGVMTSTGLAIPRLGVPRLGSGEDTHGISSGCINDPAPNSTGCPTCFPAGPNTGAAFDRELWTAIGETIGREGRALNNMQLAPLYFFDPDMNLMRDPRWGRAQEVPGECPYLTGEVGSYLIKATQEGGSNPRYFSIASTMKHSPMYDMEGYNDGKCESGDGACGEISKPTTANDYTCDTFQLSGCNRRNFDSSPPVRDFAGYYSVAFKAISQRARPSAVMCAYPAAYGIPSCAHPFNNQVLREEWGWDGVVVSDCSAIELFEERFVFPPGANFSYGGHNYSHNASDTIRAALVQGGTDADCPVASNNFYSLYIKDALKTGAIAKTDVDRAARRIFRMMFKLGMLDPMEQQQPHLSYGADQIDNAKSREVALRAATESIVLLKNIGHPRAALPFIQPGNGKQKFAFIGPHANSTQKLMSAPGYHGANTLVNTHSPLQVAQRRGWAVTYSHGCEICDNMGGKPYGNNPCRATAHEYNTSGFAQALAAADTADVIILFLGADQTTEAEGFDRRTLGLVGAQQQLLEQIIQASMAKPTPTPVVLVLVNGGPIDVSTAVQSDAVVAILETFQPGELGGDAMINLMDGTSSPSGKMPYTTYFANYSKGRDIREGNLQAGSGTTYWWMREPVLFPFGAGLEYTTFKFTWGDDPPAAPFSSSGSPLVVNIPESDAELQTLSVNHSVLVTNTGNRASPVVVLAFIVATPSSPRGITPIKKLFDFQRVNNLRPGHNVTMYFACDAGNLGVVDEGGKKLLVAGRYRVEIGSIAAPAVRELELRGKTVVVEQNGWVQAMATGRLE